MLFDDLAYNGYLEYTDGRKLLGYDLFEIRVKHIDIYRCIYCYHDKNILLLSLFKKKTQKTPKREIEKAIRRRNNIINY